MTGDRGAPHPWRRLRAMVRVDLFWHRDDGPMADLMGVTDFNSETISLRQGMTYAERRSTIAHEVLHAERGPVPPGLAPKEEHQVDKAAARWLLPDIKVVGDALAWADHHLDAAAEELAVDEDTLRTRLRHLHPAERGWLTRRFAEE